MKQIEKESNRAYINFSNEVNENIENVIIIKDDNRIIKCGINNYNIKLNKKSNRHDSYITQYNKRDDKKKKNITLLSQKRFFILMIVFFLLNIDGIFCESYIIL